MLTFVEHKPRYSEVNFLHKRSDAPLFIKAFREKVNTKTQRYGQAFRTDQGGEVVNGDLEAYVRENRIMHKQTAAYAHESNGEVECYDQTLSAMVRPALEHAPPLLEAEAYNCAC